MYGFIRAGAAVPKLKVADCEYNKVEIIDLIKKSVQHSIKILAFPELCITGYTCGDLFFQSALIQSAENALNYIITETKNDDILFSLGIPLAIKNKLYNCCVVVLRGEILGIIPKTVLPNYNEFYEERWFSGARDLAEPEITLCGQRVASGTNILFANKNNKDLVIGVEICEDLWAPLPPSSYHCLSGATMILNSSASNELAAKNEYRLNLISCQSAKNICSYIYSSAGIYESSGDMAFSGHCVIAENGAVLKESERFVKNNNLIFYDIDVELLSNDRKKNTAFKNTGIETEYKIKEFSFLNCDMDKLERYVPESPFVPRKKGKLNEICNDIFSIQIAGLAKRIIHTNTNTLILGISGGLDSTLALLVCAKTIDYLNQSREKIIGVTMPGFGTTDRTYNNALMLMDSLGISTREISIKESVLQHFKDIDHDPDIHDTTYENAQARERTQILMDIANKENGLVIGTGDLSELALGWATYNGDHMSMYSVNCGVPKTLVKVLVGFIAQAEFPESKTKEILEDILDTPVSPELLPPNKKGEIHQKTEEIVGPYELHDFFLYNIIRFGFSPSKVLYLAEVAFKDKYEKAEISKWLKIFYSRFFSQQFKRSCVPDGPKVGTVSLSPRGDFRMPSDASSNIWIKELD